MGRVHSDRGRAAEGTEKDHWDGMQIRPKQVWRGGEAGNFSSFPKSDQDQILTRRLSHIEQTYGSVRDETSV